MLADAWFPRGFEVSPGSVLREVVEDGPDWQIYGTRREGERALLAHVALARRWRAAGLLPEGALTEVTFGAEQYALLLSQREHALTSLGRSGSPQRASEALAFAAALRATRERAAEVPLHDALYVERYTVLLPTYTVSSALPDDEVLGRYLTGGVPISCRSARRLTAMLSWLPAAQLAHIVKTAGLSEEVVAAVADQSAPAPGRPFALPGRPGLEAFFQEHVIDVAEHRDRYRALGVDALPAMVLHGPPGCGKTFAVERLVEHLGWPIFHIASGTVGSPYIHETGRKVAELFATAIDHAPSVVVIDEMESFLADRDQVVASGSHRVEELAEFLRRIPEAVKADVLVIGMTNRIDMIDPAILRRGRFDHVVEVQMPTQDEVKALLVAMLAKMPSADGLGIEQLAEGLSGRPLSDVAFVVREAGRLAARSGKDRVDQEALEAAWRAAPVRGRSETDRPRIGFA